MTDVELSTDNGGTGENFTNTRFDDEAATPITSGSAPFTGSFQPEGSLATLDGKAANGTWTLRIYDDAGSDTGTLNAWSLVGCGPAASKPRRCAPRAAPFSPAHLLAERSNRSLTPVAMRPVCLHSTRILQWDTFPASLGLWLSPP